MASFFSLGVDSFYTVLENLKCQEIGDRISKLIIVHGFDIPLAEDGFFGRIMDHARRAAARMGLELIPVSTNLRSLDNGAAYWGRYEHGAALAAVGLALQGSISRVHIPASHTNVDSYPWGSHPLVDPLWSTETLQFNHDGADATRVQKIFALASHQVALDNLHVCFSVYANAKDGEEETPINCGDCEKCLRTMLSLSIAGALDHCSTFPKPLDRTKFRHLKVPDASTASFTLENAEALEKSGQDPDLARLLARILRRDRGLWGRMKSSILKGARRALSDADRRFLGGLFHWALRRSESSKWIAAG